MTAAHPIAVRQWPEGIVEDNIYAQWQAANQDKVGWYQEAAALPWILPAGGARRWVGTSCAANEIDKNRAETIDAIKVGSVPAEGKMTP